MANYGKLKESLSSALAAKASIDQIEKIFSDLVEKQRPVKGFDPCIYGICINYGIDGRVDKFDANDWSVSGLGDIQGTDILIDGIVLPEYTTIKVQYNI